MCLQRYLSSHKKILHPNIKFRLQTDNVSDEKSVTFNASRDFNWPEVRDLFIQTKCPLLMCSVHWSHCLERSWSYYQRRGGFIPNGNAELGWSIVLWERLTLRSDNIVNAFRITITWLNKSLGELLLLWDRKTPKMLLWYFNKLSALLEGWVDNQGLRHAIRSRSLVIYVHYFPQIRKYSRSVAGSHKV